MKPLCSFVSINDPMSNHLVLIWNRCVVLFLLMERLFGLVSNDATVFFFKILPHSTASWAVFRNNHLEMEHAVYIHKPIRTIAVYVVSTSATMQPINTRGPNRTSRALITATMTPSTASVGSATTTTKIVIIPGLRVAQLVCRLRRLLQVRHGCNLWSESVVTLTQTPVST